MSFSPADVPEVAAGYYWDPASASGLGGTGFKIPEGNGHTTFDLLQATVASQPTALAENGGAQFRMRKAADTHPSFLAIAAAAKAGWTGATYVGGWFRTPDSGTTLGSSILFAHTLNAGNQRRLVFQNVATVGQRIALSANGSTVPNNDFANVLGGHNWVWVELLYVPSESTPTRRAQLWFDLTERALGGSPSDFTSGTMPTSLLDATASVLLACRAGQANVDTTDFGAVYYANGIPTLTNRTLLRDYHTPGGTTHPNALATLGTARGSASVSDPSAVFNVGRARGAVTEN